MGVRARPASDEGVAIVHSPAEGAVNADGSQCNDVEGTVAGGDKAQVDVAPANESLEMVCVSVLFYCIVHVFSFHTSSMCCPLLVPWHDWQEGIKLHCRPISNLS